MPKQTDPAPDKAPEAGSAEDAVQAPVAARVLPVRLQAPYGFLEDETGRLRSWRAGDLIVDPAEIALLIDRGAPVEQVEG